MTVNGKTVTWKWVATGAVTIVAFVVSGWVAHVNGFGREIVELQTSSAEQAITLQHIAKQVDEIHGIIFEK